VNFYSHPGVLLKKHLSSVAAFSFETQPIFVLKEVSCIIGALHDFGKYTSFFQQHLLNSKKVMYSQHSFISALLSYFVLAQNYPDSPIPLIGFDAVLSHHSALSDVEDFEEFIRIGSNRDLSKFNDSVKALYAQIPDMKNHKDVILHEFEWISEFLNKNVKAQRIPDGIVSFEKKVSELLCIKNFEPNISVYRCANAIKSINLDYFFGNFEKILKQIAKDSHSLMSCDGLCNSKERIYNYFYLVFSVLIDSDKRDAGKVKQHSRLDIPGDIVDDYEKREYGNVSETEMNKIRALLYKSVNNEINRVNIDKDKIFTITAPTGSGKTLTSLSFALKLREKIKKAKGYSPRIIYSLPFISIIEQNYDVFKEVLIGRLSDFDKNESSYILPHYHLAPIRFKEDNEEKSIDESLMYIESWDSEIIVTTFIQLLYSIIAFKNRFLKKYHNICESIIILDEVQNIPIDYWNVVGSVLKDLTENLNCYVILMTATRPLIFDNYKELFLQNENTFKKMDRVEFNVHLDKEEENRVYQKFLENVEDGKSYLFVLNTIKSSQNLYEYIKQNASFDVVGCPESIEEITKSGKRPLFYLSSLIVPYERRKRIEVIKASMKDGAKPILVSTQVIEAGIDLDFDVVFRDIAPVDSIVQAAGRCNRAWKKDRGYVNIIAIEDFASYVYRKALPNITRGILGNVGQFREPQVKDIVNSFFKEAKRKAVNEDASRNIEKALHELKFSALEDFVLINDTGKESVFVAVNKDAERFITEFLDQISNANNFFERHKIYLMNRTKIGLYTVNVRCENLPQIEEGFYIVHNSQLEEYYDLEIGYKKDSVNPIW